MKRIIVATGYMGSGSSAITDLISEFENCSRKCGNFEYVFLHCPNGLFDLEDKLLKGNNAIRSDEAIRTFEEQMYKLYNKKFWWVGNYEKIVGKEFKKITDNFISNITDFNYPGYWYTHEEINLAMFLHLLLRKPLKILLGSKLKFKKISKYKDGMRISFIGKEKFYRESRNYINQIIELISGGSENVILDQFVLPFNLNRIDNYFDENLKVVVVERDPRDVFIINKYIWQKKGLSIPMPLEVNEFCAFYKKMRESEQISNSKKILRIKFEDLIYNYEKTLEKIKNYMNFAEKDHTNKFEKFDPKLSIKNTQLFSNNNYLKEIKIIEEKLSNYLYEFPYKLCNSIEETLEFDEEEGENR